MNVSEYIIEFLKSKHVDACFVVTGGQSMLLNDALCRTQEIRSIFTHHEQAASMSAEAYARVSGKLGFALVTAGPAVINALTGVIGAYVDSVPLIIVSGQSNLNHTEHMYKTAIRQYGVQGIATRQFVEKGVKYFATINDPANVAYVMEKAYYMAHEGRPGPVWIEVPLNVQSMHVPEKMLMHFLPSLNETKQHERTAMYGTIAAALATSKRPLIVAGQGVRLAGVVCELIKFAEKHKIPIVTTRLGIDLIDYKHPLFVGHPGNNGDRAANITVQNADLIIVLGSRLSTSATGHNAKGFGENATIFQIDVDEQELSKPGVVVDVRYQDNLKFFLPELLRYDINRDHINNEWMRFCEKLKYSYPVMQEEYKIGNKVNSFYAIDMLSEIADSSDVILTDAGSVFHVTCQGWKIKEGQRFVASGGLSSMGYWCAVVGASAANKGKNTIVVTGDGSFQMNIQELATVRQLNRPIKIFVINNNGYLLIRQTQNSYMDKRLFGEGPDSGLFFPDIMAIAAAYSIKGVRIEKPLELENKLRETLDYEGPVVCEIVSPDWQEIVPRVASDKQLDGTLRQRDFGDMYPFLPQDELNLLKIH